MQEEGEGDHDCQEKAQPRVDDEQEEPATKQIGLLGEFYL